MIAHRTTRRIAGIALALGLLALALAWPGWRLRAAQAAGLGARMACSCRYIDGRELSGCRQDLGGIPWMGLVRYSEDAQARRVTASVPLLAERSARLRPGYGCQPEKH